MQLLIAYISKLQRLGREAQIKLPREQRIRDMLKVWGLPYALATACDRSLFGLCDQEDRDTYYNSEERQLTFNLARFPKGSPVQAPIGSELSNRLARFSYDQKKLPRSWNFFGFQSFDVRSAEDKVALAKQEQENWSQRNLTKIISTKYHLDARYLASRIIFESIYNSLRHSDANFIQTSALKQTHTPTVSLTQSIDPYELTAESGTPAKSTMSIHYWDDGQSMLEVFSKKLDDNPSLVRKPSDPEFISRYKVSYYDRCSDNLIASDRFDSEMAITSELPDHLKLTCLTFPHVSSAHDTPGNAVAEETAKDDKRYAATGMGLYLLTHAATKIFDGSVSIRTGHYYMEIRKNGYQKLRRNNPDYNHDFSVKIWRQPKALPSFCGNIITVRLPVGPKS
jgi:hypothetical protein